jgi:hypothetical protein
VSKPISYRNLAVSHADDRASSAADWPNERIERLIDRLPGARLRAGVRWLRKPSAHWLRLPAGLLLIVGGLLSFLPILGIWMLPLGLLLLAEDVPAVRRLTDRRWPHLFDRPSSSRR